MPHAPATCECGAHKPPEATECARCSSLNAAYYAGRGQEALEPHQVSTRSYINLSLPKTKRMAPSSFRNPGQERQAADRYYDERRLTELMTQRPSFDY